MSKKPASEYLTATRQFFGDGEYWLFLPMVQMIELEQRFGSRLPDGRLVKRSLCPIYGALLDDLYEDAGKLKMAGTSNVHPGELNEILRHALIGGNCGPDIGEGTEVGPQRADRLMSLYGFPERPIEEIAALVFRVLHAVMYGDPAQREALPDVAAESDARSAKLNKQVGEMFGPAMREREEMAAEARAAMAAEAADAQAAE